MSDEPKVSEEASDSSTSVITLDELDSLFNLSVRARNVCRDNDLITLAAIAQFQTDHGGFTRLRQCGKTTAIELEDMLVLAEQHFGAAVYEASIRPEDDQTTKGPQEREWLLMDIEQRYPLLSVRARNALRMYLGVDNAGAILDKILHPKFDLRKVRNIGRKTARELEEFRWGITNRQTQLTAGGTAESSAIQLYRSLKNDFSTEESLRIRSASLLNDADQVLVLLLIKGVVDAWGQRTGSQWNSIQAFAQRIAGPGANGRAAEQQQLTSERMRQLFVKWDAKLETRLAFLNDLPQPLTTEPFIPEGPVVIISENTAAMINGYLDVAWARPFIARILARVYSEKYTLVSWDSLGVPRKMALPLDSAHPLLIRPGVVEMVLPFTRHIYSILSEPRSSGSTVVLSELAHAGGVEWSAVLAEAIPPLIACLEPRGRWDGDHLHLPPNKRKRREELIADVLQELNVPSHVNDLVERLRAIDPEREWKPEHVRSTVIRFKDRFISFSRTSTYGLRKWEQEQAGVKGGTIRSMAEDLLRSTEVPLHVDQLVEAIKPFRPTTSAGSIRLNLQMDSDQRFTFLTGGFVGLHGKHYAHTPVSIEHVPGSLMRASVMQNFIGKQLNTFKVHLANRCEASADRIERTVQAAITEGRLVVNKAGVIVSVSGTTLSADDLEQTNGELPLEW